jgi:hypothetical protein
MHTKMPSTRGHSFVTTPKLTPSRAGKEKLNAPAHHAFRHKTAIVAEKAAPISAEQPSTPGVRSIAQMPNPPKTNPITPPAATEAKDKSTPNTIRFGFMPFSPKGQRERLDRG